MKLIQAGLGLLGFSRVDDQRQRNNNLKNAQPRRKAGFCFWNVPQAQPY